MKVFWGLDSALAYKRHFPAINWLTSYSLYLDNMQDWFNNTVAEDWMSDRQRMMSLLTEEAALEEIVQMVGMDALSPGDRLKMEAARSIREDFLHQNSFHEIDTYTPLRKTVFDDETRTCLLRSGKRSTGKRRSDERASGYGSKRANRTL